ncbi:response regulator [bacterium]|nr:response regulator [bacterium]
MIYRKVLIVHDSKVIRNLLKGYLLAELDDVQPMEAGSGKEAEELAKKQKIDVVLCGIYLRDYDGHELRTKIRSTPVNAETPVIIFTSTSSDQHIDELKAHGVIHTLLAPFSSSELREMINRVCDPRKSRKMQRYSIPGTKAVIHFDRENVEADVINLSIKSVFCEFKLTSTSSELLESTYLSLRFPEEYKNILIKDIFCKMLSIRTMSWAADNAPHTVRVVWLLEGLSQGQETLCSQVLDKVEIKNKKLAEL